MDVHFVTQVVDDLLDSALDYLHRATQARASVTIQHGVFKFILASLQKGVLFRVEANA